jgi:DNA polymerase (family 10)
MTIHNRDIAAIFSRLADLLEIEGANPFRVRAYRNAAQEIASHSRSMADLVHAGEDLAQLPGIGKAIAEKVAVIVETGRLPQLAEVEARVPAALADLMQVPGLGPKRVRALYRTLGVRDPADLERAVRAHRVRELPGFGERTEQLIAEGLARLSATERRMRRIDAEQILASLLPYLAACDGVKRVEVAGSARRCCETIGDLDVLVSCRKGSPVMRRFAEYEEVAEVVSRGATRSTVRLRSGVQVDLRVVPQASFGAALQYFTGSKAHNIAVRKIAIDKGLKLNEYGLFKGARRVAGRCEEEIYARLGLRWMAPELREDRGEVERARRGTLPRLIEVGDLRGDLHCHTRDSDGGNTLAEMASAAQARGYEYLAITDHSKRVTVANGLDARRLAAQIDRIDRLNAKLDGLRVLKSCEVDILEDGRLDLPDRILGRLDLTVCSVHYRFNLTRQAQTERIIRAMDHPRFSILGHPTGRLINERPAYEVDMERLIEAAAERGCIIEVNAQPSRLDLGDTGCRLAAGRGVKLSIASDAHRADDLGLIRFGVDQARRGWIEPGGVINSYPLGKLLRALER